jgi:protein arginine N-methyltransferase 1/protein arginine N-methyltransferase 6
MIPSRVRLLLAPLDDTVLYTRDGPGFWQEPVFGFDVSSLEALEMGQGRATQLRIDPAALLASGAELLALDLSVVQADDPWRSGTVELEARRDGVLNGFCCWFVADLAPGVCLDTGPHQPETHWAQTYLPFPPRLVRAGAKIKVRYRLARSEEERRHLMLHLTVGRSTQRYLVE